MQVLMVNHILGHLGGVEKTVADTADGLRARGRTCHLAYGEQGQASLQYGKHFNGVHPCAELGGGNAPAFADIVRRVRPDVIYLHKTDGLTTYERFLGRIRVVRMVHDHDLCCPRRHKYFAVTNKICTHPMGWRCWLDGAFVARDKDAPLGLKLVNLRQKRADLVRDRDLDGIIVASTFMRAELTMNGIPPERVSIVPPVMRVSPIAPTPVPNAHRVLYVGQLVKGKGVDLLLHALAKLEGMWTATVVGDGNAKGELLALSDRLGLAQRVVFQGWQHPTDLADYYRRAKVVVVPSRWPEPFGMVGVEAMEHGRPVVAFDVGGISDWLEHERTGLLVPEHDASALSAAIAHVLSDTAVAAAMGHAGHARVQDVFSFEAYMNGVEAMLRATPRAGRDVRRAS